MNASPTQLLSRQELEEIRTMFPALGQEMNGFPLAYLDNAATTPKPYQVIDALTEFYRYRQANVHRTTHTLAYQVESLLENVREEVRTWLNGKDVCEIIFTSGATAALNLVAQSYGRSQLQAGDEVIISALEHHSNFLPWQRLCAEKECSLKTIPINEEGSVHVDDFQKLLSPSTRLVALTHVSHVTGKVLPIKELTQAAHRVGAVVVLDAAQSAPHMRLDVEALDADFLTFSAHKMYGPTGVGVLYGKRKLLEKMPPYQLGGGMIQGLNVQGAPIYAELPHRLEAGTPPMASIVGLGSTLHFLREFDSLWRRGHDRALCHLAAEELKKLGNVTCLGQGERMGILSFHVGGMHALDVAMQLNMKGIAVRSGLQCATNLMQELDLTGVVRASFAMYNTEGEVKRLVEVLRRLKS